MQKIKRALAIFLVFVFCLGFFPAMDNSAYAEEIQEQTAPEVPAEPEAPAETTKPAAPETPEASEAPIGPTEAIEHLGPMFIEPPYRVSNQMFTAYADPAGTEIIRFTWEGAETTVKTGSSGTFAGGSWSCDLDGNFNIKFTADGTFILTYGNIKTASAKLIGGGAGGEDGWLDGCTCHGGNGGGAGESKNEPISINLNQPYTVKVGRGGTNAAAGTASQFGSLIADGGQRNGGGAGGSGTESGGYGSNGGGGGAANSFFEETRRGNFSTGEGSNAWPGTDKIWGSCWNCGYNNGDGYGNGSYSDATACSVSGGGAIAGSGRGADPVSDWCPHCGMEMNPGQSGANATAPGGGGGGGGAGTGWYRIWLSPYNQSSGSREWTGATCKGGYGADGLAEIQGQAEAKKEIVLNKTSSAPEMTDGNSCYSLEGAVYGVYSSPDCAESSLLFKLTTDASGNTQSEPVELKTYYIKEISPSKGYLLDKKVYTLDMTTGNNVLNVKEVPGNDPISITITKITDDPAATLPSLEGTQFTVKFYGGQYSDVSQLPEQANRTWVIETQKLEAGNKIIYRALLNDSYKVSGDKFYSTDASGNAVLPLGTVTIQETSPADGYTVIGGYVTQAGQQISDADGIILLNVTSNDSLSGGGLNYGNEYTKTDKALYGGVKIQKYDEENGQPQGAGTLAGAEIKIITLNDNDITVAGQVYSKGDAVYTGYTDETGLFQTPSDLLPKGHYKVVEAAPPTGYVLSGKLEQEFDVIEHNVPVDLTAKENAIVDPPIRADFSLTKANGDSKEPMANVLFSITSKTSGESHTFSTDKNGYYTSTGSDLHFGAPGEGGALLYDTYVIQELECEANKGYTPADPITITVDGSSVLVQVVGIYNYLMRMQTSARFQPTGSQWSMAADGVKIRDTVSLENLISGADYILVGKLWNKTAGEFISGAECEKAFHTTSRAAIQTMDFEPINAETFAGMDIVVYEYLYKDNKLMLSHEDENDADQTLHFPKIGTSARDGENGSSVSLIKDEITIIDTVSYTGLQTGAEYTVKGKLIDAATGAAALDAAGKEIVAETSFTAENSNGSTDVTFKFKGSFETAKKLVAYEELYSENVLMAVHAELNDEGQTVYIPRISTEALAEHGHIGAVGNMTVTDTISCNGLKPGLEYTVKGRVVDKANSETVLAEAETVFTPSAQDENVQLSFNLDSTALAGGAVVVFEEIYLGDNLIAVHTDIDDPAQTVYIPKIGTSARDGENGSSVSLIKEEITIVDTVSYAGLIPGESYTVKGKLMDKETGAAALDAAGNEIVAEAEFTAENSNGSIDVTFKFKGSFETAKKLVAFEELYYKDVAVAVHTDLEDEAQTVYIPRIRTNAITPHTGEHIGTAGEMTVIDTVSYEGLKPGLEYVMYGYVINAEQPDTILGGAMTVFTAEAENGTADLELKVNAKDYAGKTVVVFEEIMLDGAVVAVHKDENDADQSIIIPVIHTTARDAELGGNTAIADDDVIIIDTVSYANLIPNKEYTIEGQLVLKSDPERVLATKELTFTPTEPNGEVELEFTLDGSELAGETIVAFETLKYNGATVAVHADINDKAQSIIFPAIKTKATVGGEKDAPARDRLTLIDEISYCNLIPGEVYTVCGELMDKKTEKKQKDANGNKITAETTFTAEDSSGTVWLTFEFNAENLKGQTLVAFDRLYLGTDTDAQPIAVHEDIDSAEQSVRFRADKPKTGDESSFALWTTLLTVGVLGTAAVSFLLFKRKKREDK